MFWTHPEIRIHSMCLVHANWRKKTYAKTRWFLVLQAIVKDVVGLKKVTMATKVGPPKKKQDISRGPNLLHFWGWNNSILGAHFLHKRPSSSFSTSKQPGKPKIEVFIYTYTYSIYGYYHFSGSSGVLVYHGPLQIAIFWELRRLHSQQCSNALQPKCPRFAHLYFQQPCNLIRVGFLYPNLMPISLGMGPNKADLTGVMVFKSSLRCRKFPSFFAEVTDQVFQPNSIPTKEKPYQAHASTKTPQSKMCNFKGAFWLHVFSHTNLQTKS